MPKVDNWEDWDEVEEKTNDEIVRNKITFKNKKRKKKENTKNEEPYKVQDSNKHIS